MTIIDQFEYSSDSEAQAAYVSSAEVYTPISGGTITRNGTKIVHKFSSSGSFVVPSGISGNVEVLVIGGGGAGGNYAGGGGGGGEDVYEASHSVSEGTYTVTVGDGGTSSRGTGTWNSWASVSHSTNGGDSSFDTLTAHGGGGGGATLNTPDSNGWDGACGGGGAWQDTPSSLVTSGGDGLYGYAGGDGYFETDGNYRAGGGGGGQSSVGVNASSQHGGNGGEGIAYTISGGSVNYCGGGGGGVNRSGGTPGTASYGGGDGSNSGDGVDGTDGTGGGGGGAYGGSSGGYYGGDGGNGVVIISYSIGSFGSSYCLYPTKESSIVESGSYSLKSFAIQTNSLNKTLTRTISPPLDLSGVSDFTGYVYSSRTGENIKIGLHDSGGTTTEIIPDITSSDTWQKFDLDISSVLNSDKDSIDSIVITIVNADSDNTFYLDDFNSLYEDDTTGTTDLIIPSPVIYGVEKDIGYGGLFIHAPVVSGSEDILATSGIATLTPPIPIIEAFSEWTTGNANLQPPLPVIFGESFSTYGSGNLVIPVPIIEASSLSTVGWGTLTVPLPKTQGAGDNGTSGTARLRATPPIILGYELIPNTTGTGNLLVPTPIIQGSELYDALVCLVMGLDAGMPLSEYTNYDFTGFAKLGETYLALSKDGNIYRLGGDTDITESIDAVFETGQDDMGTTHSKRLMGIVAGLKSDGELQYRANRVDGYGEYIPIDTTERDVIETRKIRAEKVPLSRTIGIEFSNVDGADFTVDSLELDVRISPRRSGGS